MTTQIQLRRATAAQWSSANRVLAVGEPGYILDTGQLKVGDGVTAWNDLPVSFVGPPGPAGDTGLKGDTGPSGTLVPVPGGLISTGANGNTDISGQSLNQAFRSGQYNGNNLVSAPDTGWWFVEVYTHVLNTNFQRQVVYDMSGLSNRTLTRYCAGNDPTAPASWTDWKPLSSGGLIGPVGPQGEAGPTVGVQLAYMEVANNQEALVGTTSGANPVYIQIPGGAANRSIYVSGACTVRAAITGTGKVEMAITVRDGNNNSTLASETVTRYDPVTDRLYSMGIPPFRIPNQAANTPLNISMELSTADTSGWYVKNGLYRKSYVSVELK